MSKTTRILICDDDPIVHQSLSLYLDNEEFLHDSAYDGKQALEMIKKEHYDLMLLDQMMPGMTGMEVCQAVRRESQLPIIMLTARGEEIDRILGLEMGADDYIVKPFSPREVISRIKAVLRRTSAAPDVNHEEQLTTLTYGGLEIQPERYSVKLNGQSVSCTPREVELLYLSLIHICSSSCTSPCVLPKPLSTKLAAVSLRANMLSSHGRITVTPVWCSGSHTVACPTRTPGTSVILLSGPRSIFPTRMP